MRAHHPTVGLVFALALLGAAPAARAEAPKSGPQVGELVPGSFLPLNVTGDNAGEKHCQFCENGLNPVAMIFARELSEPLTALLKRIDEATGKNSGSKMGSFVVFLSDDEDLPKRLKEFARKNKLRHTVLTIDNVAGPRRYQIAKDADVTVVLYSSINVKANHAFKKGEMTEKDVDRIIADLPKILPQAGELSIRQFQPLNVTGARAGEKNCLVCENALNPVAMVFARAPGEPLSHLIASLDAATAKHQDCKMGSFVVFLSDDPDLEKRLKETAAKAELKHTVLAIDSPAGPPGYRIAKDAEVTVVLYTRLDIKASFTFKKGEMTNQDVDRIIADLKKILPDK
jgi:hypothetical protein